MNNFFNIIELVFDYIHLEGLINKCNFFGVCRLFGTKFIHSIVSEAGLIVSAAARCLDINSVTNNNFAMILLWFLGLTMMDPGRVGSSVAPYALLFLTRRSQRDLYKRRGSLQLVNKNK